MPTEVPSKWVLSSKQLWGWLFTVIPMFLPLLQITTGKTVSAGDIEAVRTAGSAVIDNGFLVAGAVLSFIALMERILEGVGALSWLPAKKVALPAIAAPAV